MKLKIIIFSVLVNFFSATNASYFDGVDFYNEKEYMKAFSEWSELANDGDVNSKVALGVLFEKGLGVSKDYKTAIDLYTQAAIQGDSQAQHNLGVMYDQGKGVSKDYKQAFEWYQKSAKQGHVKSQYNIGAMYEGGEGVSKDLLKAFKWFKKSADKNYAKAQYSLGYMYEKGNINLKKNNLLAYKFYKKSLENEGLDSSLKKVVVNKISLLRKKIAEKKAQEARKKQKAFQAEQDQEKEIDQEDIVNKLKINYINQIALKVKEQWRYRGAKDHWACDVYILQDLNGKVQSVNLQSCIVDDSAKARSFKNSIERAVYKASPLPHAPDKSIFDRELLIHFSVNDEDKDTKKPGFFSSLWGNHDKDVLEVSNTDLSSKNNTKNSFNIDTTPPDIRTYNSDSFTTTEKYITLSGDIKDDSKIAKVTINGKEVAIKNDVFNQFVVPEYIQLGRNEFNIVSIDVFGNKSSKTIVFNREKAVAKNKDKRLAPPTTVRRSSPNAVALIIGVDKYESIASAPWAESDASVFYDYVQNALGISEDRIKLLTGSESSEAGIWKSIERWLPTEVDKNKSDVYVYFAGHGLASTDGNNAYLIPWDGDTDLLERTAILRSELIDGLKDLDAKSVTLFMDTCYSGKARGGKGTLVANSRGLRIVKKDKLNNLPSNFTLFSAAGNDETASSHPSLKHGLFSYWMMRGLGGDADSNNDRKITNGELHAFIDKNVQKNAVSMGRKQHPQLVGDKDKVISSW